MMQGSLNFIWQFITFKDLQAAKAVQQPTIVQPSMVEPPMVQQSLVQPSEFVDCFDCIGDDCSRDDANVTIIVRQLPDPLQSSFSF